MNTNAPTCHISQKKLSDVVVKHLGGRLATPKESWNKVRSQNMARHLAERSMQQRLDAAEVAAHQNRLRTAPSNPSSNGNLPSMESQKISSASQGQPQLTPNLGDVAANPWTQQPNVLPGYVQNGGSIGPPNPSQMMPPWFTPPAEVYNKYSPLPSFAGTSQSQSPLERSSMSQVRPGYGGRLKPTHLTNPLQVSPDQMMTARGTRGLYSTQSQLSMNPHYVQQSQHYAKQVRLSFKHVKSCVLDSEPMPKQQTVTETIFAEHELQSIGSTARFQSYARSDKSTSTHGSSNTSSQSCSENGTTTFSSYAYRQRLLLFLS